MVALGNRVSEQLQRLGVPADQLGAQLGNLSSAKLAKLSGNLQVAFGQAALVGNKFLGDTQDTRWNIPQAFTNPTPRASAKDRGVYVRGTYFRQRASRHESARDPFPALLDKYSKQGVVMSRFLSQSAVARKRFEKQAALTVVPDGRADGAVSVHAMTSSSSSSSAGGVPQSAWDMFMQMDQAVMAEATKLGNIAMAGADIYGSTAYATSQASGQSLPAGYFGGMGADGEGYFSGGSFAGTGETGTESTGSTDEQVLVIKRMMDKRNQMYDLFKNVLDKHNESAKTAINNMRG